MYHTIETKVQLSPNMFNFYKNKLARFSIENNVKFYEMSNNLSPHRIWRCDLLRNRGINITLANFKFNEYPYFSLILRINPKRILNNRDFLSVTHESETELLYDEVNKCLREICIPEDFKAFYIERIDYCCNYKFTDENIAAYNMEIFKRSAILDGFDIKLNYDSIQHRSIENEDAIYASNKSVTINFYNKYNQILKNPHMCYDNIDDYRGVIRFEIQCFKPKIRTMKYSNDLPDFRAFHWMKEEFSDKTLLFYINKIFCKGDYFTLPAARQIIINANFRDTTKQTMLNLLELTSEKRSLKKALDILHMDGMQSGYLNRILSKFDDINVNPVTIPLNWGIPFLESPLKLITGAIESERQLGIN